MSIVIQKELAIVETA